MPPQRVLVRALLAAGLLTVAIGTVFGLSTPGSPGVKAFADIVQLLLSAGAALASARASSRATGQLRLSWRWIAIGTGGWSIGQLAWCYYELGLGVNTPFPSVADIGFLMFPMGTAVGLWFFPNHQNRQLRLRSLLDGCVVVGALVSISWVLVLEAAVKAATDDGAFNAAVALAYPIGDVLFIAMVFYSLSWSGPHRRTQILLAVGMLAMAVSDSGFTYQTAVGLYKTGSLLDLGWVTAFLLITVAAWDAAGSRTAQPQSGEIIVDAPFILPYLPLLLAVAVSTGSYFGGSRPDLIQVGAIVVSVGAVLGRQYLTLIDNRMLLAVVAAREEQLRHLSMHDPLTGLANRALFTDRVSHALALHRRDGRPLALMFCDLDDFKAVNDTYGHPAGDELLIRVSERMRGALRAGDTLARFGGDEFAILIEDGGLAQIVGDRLIESLAEPVLVSGTLLSVQASIGMMALAADDTSPELETLLAHADIAMYSAKRAGKGRVVQYDASMMLPEIADLPLRIPLADAVTAGEITTVYQPIVSLTDDRVVGMEALARWTHEGVEILPNQFIPLAQRAGLIRPLTSLMLERACADLMDWCRQIDDMDLRVAVNVPSRLISDLTFLDEVAEVTLRHGMRRGQLILEITEDTLLGDLPTAKAVMSQWSELGVPLALDDFGAGHAPLLHLHQIPLRILKVDVGLIANLDSDHRAERFVGALLGLGRELGFDVVAEGVERPGQLEALRRLGCRNVQGFFFARPVVAADVPALLMRSLTPLESAY